MSRSILLFFLIVLLISSSGAEIYKWIDEDGNVQYGDCAPADCEPEQIETTPRPSEEDIQQARERTERLILKQKQREEVGTIEREIDKGKAKQRWVTECFSSPAEVIGPKSADPFEPISPRLLTPAEHKRLSRMFRTLEGRWDGDIEEILCFGTEHAPRTETRHYEVDSKAKRDLEGILTIESHALRVDSKTRHPRVLWLLLKKDWLRFGNVDTAKHDAPQWDVEVISIGKDSLVFIRKFRRPGRRGTSLHHLELRSLHASRRSFLIREWFYVQGSLARMQTWALER